MARVPLDARHLPRAGEDALTRARVWLSSEGEARLAARLALARRQLTAHHHARAAGPILVSVSEPLGPGHDPSAIAAASRRPGESWFCMEQPERAATALATLGVALELVEAGARRFTDLEARWQRLCEHALCDAPDAHPGVGLLAVAGFAFDERGGQSATWEGFAPASLVVPEVALARRGEQTWITWTVALRGGDDDGMGSAGAVLDAVRRRAAELVERPLPLLDPSPVGRFTVESPIPPAHYEEAVARAVERIKSGAMEKIVLAREVHVHAPADYDAAAILDVLRGGFSGCFVYAVGRGDATFVGATPELLIRREGMRASTVALAGSIRRGTDPATDDHLADSLLHSDKNRHENGVVAKRIKAALAPFSVWVTAPDEPVVVRVANIQHLATPIRAQLSDAVGALTLAGALFPTPAVGGEPHAVTSGLIPALEGLDRGWYAGALGWTDATGDGEFCVALRCALLRGRLAYCYAGAGIVADSDPAAELAETEVKLGALLPVLTG